MIDVTPFVRHRLGLLIEVGTISLVGKGCRCSAAAKATMISAAGIAAAVAHYC